MIKRDAFLYLEPKSSKHKKNFAQCSDCMMWTGKENLTCTIHGKEVKVTGTMSCGLYVEGDPMPDHADDAMALVTPEESGLVDRPVRCENCEYGDAEKLVCKLFEKLNQNPSFDLDVKIDAKGCCNANTPRKKSIDSLRQKAQDMED